MRFLPLLLIAGLLSCQDAKDTVPPPPNVLFVIGDDISWPHLSAYGTSWVRTPNCDRIAAEGLMFSNAYTPNAKCGPSRSILLTGRNGWQLGPAINHLAFWPDTLGSIWEALNYAGYHTGFTGKGWAPGNPGERNGAPRQLTGRRYSALALRHPLPPLRTLTTPPILVPFCKTVPVSSHLPFGMDPWSHTGPMNLARVPGWAERP
jgi:N-sulfoglucosamine sulfohydrolase